MFSFFKQTCGFETANPKNELSGECAARKNSLSGYCTEDTQQIFLR